ncbi:MAG: phage holin family protein, partial [Planctomycetota bacterium]
LTGLPVLVVWAALLLPEAMRAGCLLLVGLVLVVGAILAGWLAWRRFRREFVGLEETLEELREDLVWLREWAGKSEDEEGTDSG